VDADAAVVLVDCAGGRELEVVRDALTRPLNTPTVLIDHTALVSTAISLDVDTGLLHVDGRPIRPAVVWLRHTAAHAMMARTGRPGSLRPLDAASWSGLLEQLAAWAATALPGKALVWPGQLADVRRLGMTAPRTVIATDVVAAARQLGTRRVIVKTPDFRLFEPDRRTWAAHLPQILDRDAAPDGPATRTRPVVVQEYVVHDRELRVYFLNGGVCAFDVHKRDPASFWTDPDHVTVTRVDCPENAASAVRALCTAWNLIYAAFDLLVTPTGELVFVEANPDGGWLWFEGKARWHGVSLMAAVMVRELFVRGTSWGARADDCRPG
jgi:hypothetical protein